MLYHLGILIQTPQRERTNTPFFLYTEVNEMKKCRALGEEWTLISVNGEQAVIENKSGRFSILKKNIEIEQKKVSKKDKK